MDVTRLHKLSVSRFKAEKYFLGTLHGSDIATAYKRIYAVFQEKLHRLKERVINETRI